MISINGLKRKSSSIADNNPITTKRFRDTVYDGNIHRNDQSMSLNMTIKQDMTSEYRQLQYELQCQEALLVLMQKLKTNQRILTQTNNVKQRTTTTPTPTTTATKQPSNSINRSTPTKPPHPNQYTVNRSNNNSQHSSSKLSVPLPQATRQSNNSPLLPATATRLSSTVPTSATKLSSVTSSTTNNSSKNNGITTDQHLLTAKLALRKQLEQTLLQIPTPKPSTCDLTYIPGINGWAEFLTSIGLEQAFNTYTDIHNRRLLPEISINLPYVCAQCGTDWSVTWHDVTSDVDEKILCDRCRKTSQKKILKQDHSNRLRQAFMKALQQEKELDAKYQTVKQTSSSPSPSSLSIPTTIATAATTTTTTTSSSSSHNKHSSKPLSTKVSSSKHHHSGKTSSSKHSINNNNNNNNNNTNTINPLDMFTSSLAALPTHEQIELFQKHFLSNMFQFNVANQAAALAAKSTQQQQALAASLPAMAASLMHQANPAQYLLDMIPQATKQQQHHHRHSK